MVAQRAGVLLAAISTILLLGDWGGTQARAAQQDEARGETSGESSNVTLEIDGDKGTRFSGSCTLGEERYAIASRVPQSYEYDLEDRKLACEIRKEDSRGEELEIVLSGEGARSSQQIAGGEAVVRLTYDGGSVSSSMSSFSSKQANKAAGFSSSAAGEAGRGDDEQASPADRVQQKVNKILDQVGL